MGLIFTPVLVRCLVGPLGLAGPMTSTSWTHIATPNSPVGRYNPPLACHPLHLLICTIRDIPVVVKKVA